MKLFNTIKVKRPRKSKFDLSHERKMSLQMGDLVPFFVQETLPGDSFANQSEVFMRMAPMLTPIMHRMNVYTHFFFVPNRIIWNEWEDFITGGKDGTASPIHPYLSYRDSNNTYFQKKGLADYMGIPPISGAPSGNMGLSALPFRAYTQIYNDYYRDQNLIDEIDFAKTSGMMDGAVELDKIMLMRKRAWQHDYFTSCLPWSQRGEEVTMQGEPVYSAQAQVLEADGSVSINPTGNELFQRDDGSITNTSDLGDPKGLANLESVGITINELRRSTRLQEWLEKNARGGARYVEQLLSHWGVLSDDARLQRAEYLGGGKTPISISEVLQTSGTEDAGSVATPLGEMGGHGIAVGANHRFKGKFKEHGFVIGIMSVLPVTSYQQGIEKAFRRFDKLDYPWPEFAQLGEQEVLNWEVMADLSDSTIADTFGYQSRYAECKFKNSSVHGDFRDNLSYWHMGRQFSSMPLLNQSFVEADPTKRIFAVEDGTEDELYCQVYNNFSAIRPLPYYGTPTL